MIATMNDWIIVSVRKGTPLEATESILKSSRIRFGKRGYTFSRYHACDYHVDYMPWCDECEEEKVTYTDEDRYNSALDSARKNATLHSDSWLIDGETNTIVAAFRLTLESIL